MGTADYSVGRRVYNGAGNAPTRGTVDPMGYVERGLNNPSQRRSGLARAALSRLAPGGPPQQEQGVSDSIGGIKHNRTATGMSSGISGPVSGGVAGGAPGASNAPVPGLKVNDIGKLSPGNLGSASTGATSLPFDAEAADAQLLLQGQRNRFDSDYTAETGRIEREYTNQKRDLDKQVPDAQRGLLENYSGRGMAYSSGYGHDQAKQKGQFADLQAQLEQGRTGGLADLLRQQGLFNDDYSSRLQAIQNAAARRLAEQAGDLGLGGEGIQEVGDDLFGQVSAPAPVDTGMGMTGNAPPQQAPQQVLNDPNAAPSHMNPYYDPRTQVPTPNMIDGGDPGMRGGKTIAQIAAEAQTKAIGGITMGMTPEQVAAILGRR